jgi:hypothetical protein
VPPQIIVNTEQAKYVVKSAISLPVLDFHVEFWKQFMNAPSPSEVILHVDKLAIVIN